MAELEKIHHTSGSNASIRLHSLEGMQSDGIDEQGSHELNNSALMERARSGNWHYLNVFAGLMFIITTFPILWTSEHTGTALSTLYRYARSDMVTVSSEKADPANDDHIVAVTDATIVACTAVQDGRFDVTLTNCLRMRSEVQVYVNEEWMSVCKDCGFKQEGLELGPVIKDCSRVTFGEGFVLSEGLVSQFDEWELVGDKLPDVVKHGSLTFTKGRDDMYLWRKGMDELPPEPAQPGDCRVQFEYVPNPDGEMYSVVAVQVYENDKKDEKRTFVPCRPVGRRYNRDKGEEALQLRVEGRKSVEQFTAETEIPWILTWCTPGLLLRYVKGGPTELYRIFPGNNLETAFHHESMSSSMCQTSVLILAFGLMWQGIALLCQEAWWSWFVTSCTENCWDNRPVFEFLAAAIAFFVYYLISISANYYHDPKQVVFYFPFFAAVIAGCLYCEPLF